MLAAGIALHSQTPHSPHRQLAAAARTQVDLLRIGVRQELLQHQKRTASQRLLSSGPGGASRSPSSPSAKRPNHRRPGCQPSILFHPAVLSGLGAKKQAAAPLSHPGLGPEAPQEHGRTSCCSRSLRNGHHKGQAQSSSGGGSGGGGGAPVAARWRRMQCGWCAHGFVCLTIAVPAGTDVTRARWPTAPPNPGRAAATSVNFRLHTQTKASSNATCDPPAARLAKPRACCCSSGTAAWRMRPSMAPR